MADFYGGLSKTVSKITNKFGKQITIHQKIEGAFNPVTGTDATERTKKQKVKAVVLPASGGKIQALDLRYGLTGMQYQKLSYCIVAGSDFKWIPEPGDLIYIGAEKWTLLGATPTNPNEGDPIMYEMALRI